MMRGFFTRPKGHGLYRVGWPFDLAPLIGMTRDLLNRTIPKQPTITTFLGGRLPSSQTWTFPVIREDGRASVGSVSVAFNSDFVEDVELTFEHFSSRTYVAQADGKLYVYVEDRASADPNARVRSIEAGLIGTGRVRLPANLPEWYRQEIFK